MREWNLRIADLHTHSCESDGALTPAQLVKSAAAAGILTVALTDHDTTSGLKEAVGSARNADVDVVAGIEISAYHGAVDFHVLGYFVDPDSQQLLAYQDRMVKSRRGRIDMILSRLRDIGVNVDVPHKRGTMTRSHVARAIVAAGHVADSAEAFERYLAPGTPAHVRAAVINVQSAIELVHAAGGVASLAHPGDWTAEDDIARFVDWGLDAIEVIHPSHDARLTEYYAALAERLGILKTGGSDFHARDGDGSAKLGQFNVPRSWLLELQNRSIRRKESGL